MNPLWLFILSPVAGALLSGLFLLSLRQSLRRLRGRRHPLLGWLGHFLLRCLLLFAMFYGLLQLGGWQFLLGAVFGFTVARAAFIYLIYRYRAVPQ